MSRPIAERLSGALQRQAQRFVPAAAYARDGDVAPAAADGLAVWQEVRNRLPATVTAIPDEHLVALPLVEGEPLPGITIKGQFGPGSWLFRDRRFLDVTRLKISRGAAEPGTPAEAIVVFSGGGLSVGKVVTTAIKVVGRGAFVALGYLRRFPAEITVGHDARLTVGDLTSTAGLDVKVTKGSVAIGRDCQIGGDTRIRALHFHGVVDLAGPEPHEVLAKTPDVVIGDHVWLGEETRIMGNARIDDGSVLGAFSVLAGRIPANCIAVGNPARVVREQRTWSRASTKLDADTADYITRYKKSLASTGTV